MNVSQESRECFYLNTNNRPEDRCRILKPFKDLESMNSNSSNIFLPQKISIFSTFKTFKKK